MEYTVCDGSEATDGVHKSMEQQRVMTIEEAAAVLRVSRPTAYRAVKKGQIPVIRIGTRMLVPVEALDRILAGETAQPAPEH